MRIFLGRVFFIFAFLMFGFLFFSEQSHAAAWDVSDISYTGFSSSTSPASSPSGMFFRADGAKVYVSNFNDTKIYQFSLNTPWDITTLSYDNKFKDVGSQGSPEDVALSEDGTKMFMLSFYATAVYQYTLGTAWDVSTATFDSVVLSLGSSNHYDFHVKRDGSKVFSLNDYQNRVQQYTLSTPWSLSSSAAGSHYSYSSLSDGQEIVFTMSDNGENMYIGTNTNDRIHWYTLSTPWNSATASYTSSYFSVNAQDTALKKVVFNPSGTVMYTLGSTNDKIYQYVLDNEDPAVDALSPEDDEIDVLLDSDLVVTFDEEVNVETGNILIKRTSDNSTFATIDVTDDDQVTGDGTNTITIDPDTDFESGAEYYVQIATTAFDDLAGNSFAGITDTTTWTFTVETVVTGGGNSSYLTGVCDVSDTEIEVGDEVDFTIEIESSESDYDFEWVNVLSGDDLEESHSFDEAGKYYVRGHAEDEVDNSIIIRCDTIEVLESEGEDSDDEEEERDDSTDVEDESDEDSSNTEEIESEDNNIDEVFSENNSKVIFTKDLFRGMYDDEVILLQKFLNQNGFIVSESGDGSVGNETNFFGPKTKDAVSRFQTTHSIFPNAGYFGILTRTKSHSLNFIVDNL